VYRGISFVRLTFRSEFTLAEIEHFCDPQNKSHPRFVEVAHMTIPVLTGVRQEEGASDAVPINLGDAVRSVRSPSLSRAACLRDADGGSRA
jgi:glycyl-tRNA synthetase (class II)